MATAMLASIPAIVLLVLAQKYICGRRQQWRGQVTPHAPHPAHLRARKQNRYVRSHHCP